MYRFDGVSFGRMRNKPPVDRLLDIVDRFELKWIHIYNADVFAAALASTAHTKTCIVCVDTSTSTCHILFCYLRWMFGPSLPSYSFLSGCVYVVVVCCGGGGGVGDSMWASMWLYLSHLHRMMALHSRARRATNIFTYVNYVNDKKNERMPGVMYNIELLDVLLTLCNFMHA